MFDKLTVLGDIFSKIEKYVGANHRIYRIPLGTVNITAINLILKRDMPMM